MPPLVDTSLVSSPGSSLTPSTSGLAQLIGNAIQKKQTADREDARLKQIEDAKKVQQVSKTNAAQLLRVRGIKDFQTQRKELAKLGQAEIAAGRDPSLFVEALNANSPDELNLAITRAATAQGNADKLIEAGLSQVKSKPSIKAGVGPSGEPGFFAVTPEGAEQIPGIKPAKRAPLVQIGGGKEEQKELAKLRAQDLSTLRAKGGEAEQQIVSLNILDNIDVSTGAAEPMKQALANFAEGFGVDASSLADVAQGQAFTAEAGKVVLRVLATQKGPQTDNDRANIAKTISRLGNRPEANVFINNAARATAERTIEQRDFFDDWLDQNDTLKGAASGWNKKKKDVPMISQFVRNEAGLPVFFFRFRDRVKQANPDASDEQIVDAWKSQEASARAKRK